MAFQQETTVIPMRLLGAEHQTFGLYSIHLCPECMKLEGLPDMDLISRDEGDFDEAFEWIAGIFDRVGKMICEQCWTDWQPDAT